MASVVRSHRVKAENGGLSQVIAAVAARAARSGNASPANPARDGQLSVLAVNLRVLFGGSGFGRDRKGAPGGFGKPGFSPSRRGPGSGPGRGGAPKRKPE